MIVQFIFLPAFNQLNNELLCSGYSIYLFIQLIMDRFSASKFFSFANIFLLLEFLKFAAILTNERHFVDSVISISFAGETIHILLCC